MPKLRLPKKGAIFILLFVMVFGALPLPDIHASGIILPAALTENGWAGSIFIPMIANGGNSADPANGKDPHGKKPTPTPTPSRTASPTSIPPTATPTNSPTPLPPTATSTNSPVPPTATPVSISTPLPSATPNAQPMPVGQSGNWKLVFNDDFNGSSLDASKWRTCFWWADTTCSIETNNELELYNPEDVIVQSGLLRLRAQQRDMVGWNGQTYHYTSGMVMTGGRSGSIPPEFKFTYGYVEARFKIPAGQGLWPAFWMLPANYTWPPEIDIMEILGNQPNVDNMTLHYNGGQSGTAWTGPDFSAGWHVFGLDWEPDSITWYVDGVAHKVYTDQANIPNSPMYLLLNLAIGGNWPGSPNASTPFPSNFDIDYVRVWQK